MTGSGFLQQLNSGKRLYGTAVVCSSPSWPGAVKRAGADFVFIDTEHTPLDRGTVAQMCLAYGALGLPPLVRTPSPDPYEACKVLDAGAAGVLAPYIEHPEQVSKLVGAAKMRPLKGQRLEAALEDFAGCAVIISHDRFFLDRMATHILSFEGDSHVEWFEGNFADYLEDKKRRLGEAAVEPHRIKFKRFERR